MIIILKFLNQQLQLKYLQQNQQYMEAQIQPLILQFLKQNQLVFMVEMTLLKKHNQFQRLKNIMHHMVEQ